MKKDDVIFECRRECAFSDPRTGRQFIFGAFTLNSGDFVLIDGESDTDISMVLQILAGHLPTEVLAVSGDGGIAAKSVPLDFTDLSLFLCGKEVYQDGGQPSELGFVYSDPDLGIVGRTVLEDYYHALVAVGGCVEEKLATLQLAPFDLSHKLRRETTVLSDGEKQRLNCATACCGDPSLLICDLSTSNLDQAFIDKLVSWCGSMCAAERCVIMSGVAEEKMNALPAGVRLRRLKATRNCNIIKVYESSAAPSPSLGCEKQKHAIMERFSPRNIGGSILSVQGLHRRDITFPVTFEVGAGEVVQIIGRNGSGKTTLGRALIGIIKGKELIGSFRFSAGVRPVMSFQFPDRSILFPTVERELPDTRLRTLIDVEQFREDDPRELSVSKKKLINVANALSLASGLAILDEPTCGMDWKDKLLFVDLLNYFATLSVMIITHDQSLDLVGRKVEIKEVVSCSSDFGR